MKPRLPLFLLLCLPVSAAGFGQLQSRANRDFQLLERLHSEYPVFVASEEKSRGLQDKWKSYLRKYETSDKQNRSVALRQLGGVYEQLQNHLSDLCKEMDKAGEEFQHHFRDKLKAKSEKEKIDPDKYVSAVQVSRQEMERARDAFRKEQFYYSAHLYSRSFEIMRKTYKKLGWAQPADFYRAEKSGRK